MMKITAKAHLGQQKKLSEGNTAHRVAVQPARPHQKLSILTFEPDGKSTLRRFASAKTQTGT